MRTLALITVTLGILALTVRTCMKNEKASVFKPPSTFDSLAPAINIPIVFRGGPSPRPSPVCIRLMYNGYNNEYGVANMTPAEKQSNIDSLLLWFKQWNITFTEEDEIFNMYATNRRHTVIIYGDTIYNTSYGISSVGSIGRGEDMYNPSRVSSFRLYNDVNSPLTGEARVSRTIAHEIGHAFGCWHQTDSCVNNYRNGYLMGWPLSPLYNTWITGSAKDNAPSCFIQNDIDVINLIASRKRKNQL